jgi:signal transduction histidine kinase
MIVADDGPGFAAHAPSDRAARQRKGGRGRPESTGLGLSIVERIVAVCGGSLKIDCPAPGGTRCVIRLPASAPAIPQAGGKGSRRTVTRRKDAKTGKKVQAPKS